MDSELLWLLPLGFLIGSFGTYVGAGGGFVLVPVLLLLYPSRAPETVTAISLLVAATNALSGSIAYSRQQRIDYRSALWFAAATLPGAFVGVIAVGYVPRQIFDGLFAVVLAGVALIVLRRRAPRIQDPQSGAGIVQREIRDGYGNRYVYRFNFRRGMGLSGLTGLLSSLLGIGGGVFHVPIMATVLHFPIHVAVATSQFILLFMTASATGVHAFRGNFTGDGVFTEAAMIAIGAVAGAQVGAWLGQRSQQSAIRRALGISLVVISARLAMQAAGY